MSETQLGPEGTACPTGPRCSPELVLRDGDRTLHGHPKCSRAALLSHSPWHSLSGIRSPPPPPQMLWMLQHHPLDHDGECTPEMGAMGQSTGGQPPCKPKQGPPPPPPPSEPGTRGPGTEQSYTGGPGTSATRVGHRRGAGGRFGGVSPPRWEFHTSTKVNKGPKGTRGVQAKRGEPSQCLEGLVALGGGGRFPPTNAPCREVQVALGSPGIGSAASACRGPNHVTEGWEPARSQPQRGPGPPLGRERRKRKPRGEGEPPTLAGTGSFTSFL